MKARSVQSWFITALCLGMCLGHQGYGMDCGTRVAEAVPLPVSIDEPLHYAVVLEPRNTLEVSGPESGTRWLELDDLHDIPADDASPRFFYPVFGYEDEGVWYTRGRGDQGQRPLNSLSGLFGDGGQRTYSIPAEWSWPVIGAATSTREGLLIAPTLGTSGPKPANEIVFLSNADGTWKPDWFYPLKPKDDIIALSASRPIKFVVALTRDHRLMVWEFGKKDADSVTRLVQSGPPKAQTFNRRQPRIFFRASGKIPNTFLVTSGDRLREMEIDAEGGVTTRALYTIPEEIQKRIKDGRGGHLWLNTIAINDDVPTGMLAAAPSGGWVVVWKLSSTTKKGISPPNEEATYAFEIPEKAAVRSLSFNNDGTQVVVATDRGLWRLSVSGVFSVGGTDQRETGSLEDYRLDELGADEDASTQEFLGTLEALDEEGVEAFLEGYDDDERETVISNAVSILENQEDLSAEEIELCDEWREWLEAKRSDDSEESSFRDSDSYDGYDYDGTDRYDSDY